MLQNLFRHFSYTDYLQKIVRRPATVVFLMLAITIFFATQVPRLSFKTSIYDLEIENLPETIRYEEFKKLFGSDEIIRIVVTADDIFDPITFGKIGDIAETLSKIEGVRRVISLPGIKQAVDLSGSWSLDKFFTVISHVQLFSKYLISSERQTTALTVVLTSEADPEHVIGSIEQVLDAVTEDLSLYQVGMPLVSQALMKFRFSSRVRKPPDLSAGRSAGS